MSKHRAASALAALCLLSTPALAAAPGDIVGLYWNPDKTRKIQIVEESGVFRGTVVWEAAPEDGESLVGHEVARGFRFDGEEKWVDGEVISPLDGSVYSGFLWLEDGKLMMRGYVGFSFLGKTASWERAE